MQTLLDKKNAVGREGIDLTLLVSQVISNNDASQVYSLAPPLASVSASQCASYKSMLKGHFQRRLNMRDLDAAIKEARKSLKRKQIIKRRQEESTLEGTLPTIELGGQLRDEVQDVLHTLVQANKDKPSLFVQSGRLSVIHFLAKSGPVIAELSLSGLLYRMSQAANYVTIHSTSEDIVSVPSDPPLDVARVILEGMNPADYPFPHLVGITELPILRENGDIYTVEGYDTHTEQVYMPNGLVIPSIPDAPSDDQVKDALSLLDFWLSGFPFEDAASKATIIADAITVVIRAAIPGQVPLTLLDAPKQGSGKTILAQAIGQVATGRVAPVNAPFNDEEECRKKMLTWLMKSPAVVIIDNLIHVLESPTLNSALTSEYVEDRELGSNTLIHVSNRAVWFASGNNIRVGDDTARRCIKCRLDAKLERPNTRKGFQIADGVHGFQNWTLEHRAELIAALLTLTRNWYAKGKPECEVTPLGNFEAWTTIIGGILYAAGIRDFLANLNDEDGYSSIDEVSLEWEAFVVAIHALYGEEPFVCAELTKKMLETDTQSEDLRDSLPASLTKNYDSYRKSQGNDMNFSLHVGHSLRSKKGQIYGNLRIESAGKNRANKVQWRIASMDVPQVPAQVSMPSQEIETSQYEEQPLDVQEEIDAAFPSKKKRTASIEGEI